MKLKTSVKQQFLSHFMMVISASLAACLVLSIYYICIAAHYANEPVGAIMVACGYDILFVFIMIFSAFYYYKSELNLCFQLSNSKTGLFISKLITGLSASAACSVISVAFCFGVNSICRDIINTSSFHIELRPFFTETMYYKDYHTNYFFGQANNTEKILFGIIMMLFASFAVYVFCLFIASLFYRVNLIAKILIVFIPILLIYVGIPIVDMFATKGTLSEGYLNIIHTMYGMTYKSPLICCMISVGIAILFSAVLYFVMKKSQIRK